MATEYKMWVPIAGAQFLLRFIPQPRRRQIRDLYTRGRGFLAETDDVKLAEHLAQEMIVDWSGVTQEVLLHMGFVDFEELSFNGTGAQPELPYSAQMARRLYMDALPTKFRNEVDRFQDEITSAAALEKKDASVS